jgi:hypothetical protein
VHYGSERWSGTLTVLPQVHGTPATEKGLELIGHEKVETRLVASVFF